MIETGGSTLEAIRILVALLAAAALAGVAIRWLRIPYSVALVAIGLIAGVLLPAGAIQVTPELVLLVLLPGSCSRPRSGSIPSTCAGRSAGWCCLRRPACSSRRSSSRSC